MKDFLYTIATFIGIISALIISIIVVILLFNYADRKIEAGDRDLIENNRLEYCIKNSENVEIFDKCLSYEIIK